MRTIIYYFSGTGNNLYCAKQIAANLPGTDIQPIRELKNNKTIPEEYDWVGFIGPSYYSHIPPFMNACMENVKYTDHQKIFLICACAGNRAMAIQDMRKQINASGKISNLEYMIIQPGSYLLSYGAFPSFYQNLTIAIANRKIRHIVDDIINNRQRKNLKPGLIYRESDEARLQKNINAFPEMGHKYQINSNCTGCGMCARICPVENITIQNGKVVFGDHCSQCMACIQWCKQRAILFDEKEQSRKRYHNPKIKVTELNQPMH